MPGRSTGNAVLDALFAARRGRVDVVDVPEFGFLVVEGVGAPESPTFAEAVQALYSVSYAAHFAVKKALGEAPRVMPLEAQWWVEGAGPPDPGEDPAAHAARMMETDRAAWRWRAMILQLDPIDEPAVGTALRAAHESKPSPGLDRLTYLRWAEGPSAQTLHVGPYRAERPTIEALHRAIAERGLVPRGHHHEIYLGDPRRSAPEKLRTILRHPVEPAGG